MQCVTALWTAWFGVRSAELILLAKASLDLLMIGWIFVGSADCLLQPALGLHETSQLFTNRLHVWLDVQATCYAARQMPICSMLPCAGAHQFLR